MKDHLKVSKEDAQAILQKLRKGNWIDFENQIQRDTDNVYIPLKNTEVDEAIGNLPWVIVSIEPVPSKDKHLPKLAGGAFDLIGDIAITKIRERDRAIHLADALTETHPNIKGVFLDKGITGPFRLRDLELLRGGPGTITQYRENGVIFRLDVSKVYFSPRLATERMFVSREVRVGENIIDMFAGIGAFSLNIAKTQKASIYAIDSNPDAIKYMKESIALNRLIGTIEPICGDSLEIINALPDADRIIMNLPHESHRYLRKAIEKLRRNGILHYYEILDMKGIEERMEEFRDLGLFIMKKREVHGYSSSLTMYSLTAAMTGE